VQSWWYESCWQSGRPSPSSQLAALSHHDYPLMSSAPGGGCREECSNPPKIWAYNTMDTPQFNCQVLHSAYGVHILHFASSNHEPLLLLQLSSGLFAMLMIFCWNGGWRCKEDPDNFHGKKIDKIWAHNLSVWINQTHLIYPRRTKIWEESQLVQHEYNSKKSSGLCLPLNCICVHCNACILVGKIFN